MMVPRWRDVERALRQQGFIIQATKSGFMIVAPNGYRTSLHRSLSPGAIRKAVSHLKNYGGFQWPPGKGEQ